MQLTKPAQTMLHIQIASLLEKRNDTVKLERLAQSGVIQLTPMAEVDLKDLMWKPMPVYKLINL